MPTRLSSHGWDRFAWTSAFGPLLLFLSILNRGVGAREPESDFGNTFLAPSSHTFYAAQGRGISQAVIMYFQTEICGCHLDAISGQDALLSSAASIPAEPARFPGAWTHSTAGHLSPNLQVWQYFTRTCATSTARSSHGPTLPCRSMYTASAAVVQELFVTFAAGAFATLSTARTHATRRRTRPQGSPLRRGHPAFSLRAVIILLTLLHAHASPTDTATGALSPRSARLAAAVAGAAFALRRLPLPSASFSTPPVAPSMSLSLASSAPDATVPLRPCPVPSPAPVRPPVSCCEDSGSPDPGNYDAQSNTTGGCAVMVDRRAVLSTHSPRSCPVASPRPALISRPSSAPPLSCSSLAFSSPSPPPPRPSSAPPTAPAASPDEQAAWADEVASAAFVALIETDAAALAAAGGRPSRLRASPAYVTVLAAAHHAEGLVLACTALPYPGSVIYDAGILACLVGFRAAVALGDNDSAFHFIEGYGADALAEFALQCTCDSPLRPPLCEEARAYYTRIHPPAVITALLSFGARAAAMFSAGDDDSDYWDEGDGDPDDMGDDCFDPEASSAR